MKTLTLVNKIMFFVQQDVLNASFLGMYPKGNFGFNLTEFSQWEGMKNYTRLVVSNWQGVRMGPDQDRIAHRAAFRENAKDGCFALIHEGEVRFLTASEEAWLEHIWWAAMNGLPQPVQFVKLDDEPLEELTFLEMLEKHLRKDDEPLEEELTFLEMLEKHVRKAD